MKPALDSRRHFIKQATAAMGGFSLPDLLSSPTDEQPTKKKIVVVGGHPDDPECGVGGTIPRLIRAGHAVTLMYFTNGDEGIAGKDHAAAAAIRRNECLAACRVLGTKALFVNQIDGESVINNPEMARFQQLLYAEKPDVVFAHWPIDSHKDHQLSSVLTMQSWMETPRPFTLYFYEVCLGYQSFLFHPTDYVDISETQAQKWKALACHASQHIIGPDGRYTKDMEDCGHPAMESFRGREMGVRAAEAFIRMTGRGAGTLVV